MPQASAFIHALLNPRRIALIGASDNPNRTAGRPLRYLRCHGFEGTVYPINPRRETVQGEPAWESLAALPETVDHAYILLDTAPAMAAMEACATAGVPVVSVLADGFAEDGPEGAARQQALADTAAAAGIRLLGPNSMCVANVTAGMALTVNAAFECEDLIPGRTMVLSQSGSLMGTLLSRGQARGIGFHALMSLGNEADLTIGEIGLAAVDDPNIDCFVLFMETIRRPDMLAAFAAAAHRAGKPIVVYKLGRSAAGQQLAVSHTGAMIGSDAAADAFFRAHGIVRVDQFESLFEIPPLLVGRRPDPARAEKSVAVVTTTGGGGAMVVDRLGHLGIACAGATPEVAAKLAAAELTVRGEHMLDVTLAGTRYETMRLVLQSLADDPAYAAVVPVIGSSAQFHPELAVKAIVDLADHATPLAGFMVPQADASLSALAAAGLAGFRTAESCAEALAAFMRWQAPSPPAVVDPPAIDGDGPFDEAGALTLFQSLGVPVARTHALGPDDPAPTDLTWPVAVKVRSAALAHKSDVGGVVLGVDSPAALVAARDDILAAVAKAAPTAAVDGVVVQEMASGLGEVLVGINRDPTVGPVVVLGLGGVMAELYGQTALRLAPVDKAGALAMIDEVAGLALLKGFRGQPRGDLAALADAIVAFSALAANPRVLEAEINPLIVRAEGAGVVAVDGLLRLAD